MIEEYSSKIIIYTDGAKSNDGKVAAACSSSSIDLEKTYRIEDDSSILNAELYAIKMGIEGAEEVLGESGKEKLAILTDSLSALRMLQDGRGESSTERQIRNMVANSSRQYEFVWIPGHSGIEGNEYVDNLVKNALKKPRVEVNLPRDQNSVTDQANEYVIRKWQKIWEEAKIKETAKKICPLVNGKIKFTCKNRDKETFVTRLRLGCTLLNAYRFPRSNYNNGNCNECGIKETIEHALMECTKNTEMIKNIKQTCTNLHLKWSINNILNTKEIIDIIYPAVKNKLGN